MLTRKSSVRRSRSSFMLPGSLVKTLTIGKTEDVLRGKRRFKAFARRLIWSITWVKEIEDESEAQIMQQLSSRTKTKKGIPKEAKKILIKPPNVRSHEERQKLIGLLANIYFYNRYPKKEYEQLILCTTFMSYGPGRVILRQGHMVNSESRLYYIVHGHLSVEIETVDQITLVKSSEMTKKLGPGDFFGEIPILFNDVRDSTISSMTTVELLSITKGDFDAILKESLEKEWKKTRDALMELPYFFSDWTDVEIRRCSIISNIKFFKDGDLILGDGYGKDKKAHFIIFGEVCIIQDILVEKKKGRFFLIPYKLVEIEKKKFPKAKCRYLQTTIFSKGACFGVGEKRNHRRYIAQNDVACLMVPEYLLIAHKRFDTYRQFLESRLCSETDLFNGFLYERNRLKYRKKVLDSLQGRASLINNTTIWDVPRYNRIMSPQIGLCKVPKHVVAKIVDSKYGLRLSAPESTRLSSRKIETRYEEDQNKYDGFSIH